MKNISIIVAAAENNAIGKDNKLLCYIFDDLKRFKQLTTGHKILMGKKTYESLPKGALPNRTNIVITDSANEKIEGCVMAYSITEAIELCDDTKENFIIGGGSIYSQFMEHANKLYITRIHKSFDADTFFPEINHNDWNLCSTESYEASEKNECDYSYLIYERKNKMI
ncbi:MAG: dihydrofolate reductase [Bacteroidetes bacterium]|jgi:dihydrofolate reductase|nr:dihydrofolate reductase [Bacteroidota bacterium]MBT6684909.1 dihydrofolate reductase [Bacteroidota bacterium]MBT7145214.1 dihydrofolate reductase [Bacteroidota bacterium]MBT7492986.1 dihydrofolate reductase [Bacteroidota bacterium]